MDIHSQIQEIKDLEEHYIARCNEGWSNSHETIQAFHNWYHAVLKLFKDYYPADYEDFLIIKNQDVSGNGFILYSVFRQIAPKYVMMLDDIEKGIQPKIARYPIQADIQKQENKPHKIFISHRITDKPFVKELVKMLEFIVGSDESRIFCSSVSGYDIKPGREILTELKKQFDENEIYFVVVHSPRYYESAICLNEMGAAWILGTRFCSFLTDDCSFDMLTGAIDGKYISIKVNDEQDVVTSKLNYMKDELLQIFSIDKGTFNNNRWETLRNEFIKNTQHLDYKPSAKKATIKVQPSAKIEAEIRNTKPLTIDIVNNGEGTAEQLEVKLDDVCSDMIITGLNIFPLEYLKTGKRVSLNVYQCISDPDKFKIYFSWKENGISFISEELIVL